MCFPEERHSPYEQWSLAYHSPLDSTSARLKNARRPEPANVFPLFSGAVFLSRVDFFCRLLFFSVKFFGFDHVSCPSQLFPCRSFGLSLALFAHFGLCSEELHSLAAAADAAACWHPLVVTWCAAKVSAPPAGFSVLAVLLAG